MMNIHAYTVDNYIDKRLPLLCKEHFDTTFLLQLVLLYVASYYIPEHQPPRV